jgi:hypothetical protein
MTNPIVYTSSTDTLTRTVRVQHVSPTKGRANKTTKRNLYLDGKRAALSKQRDVAQTRLARVCAELAAVIVGTETGSLSVPSAIAIVERLRRLEVSLVADIARLTIKMG